MRRQLTAVLAAAIALSSAALAQDAPLSTDTVKDAFTAIRMGITQCFGPGYGTKIPADWHADLHGRTWDVWEGPDFKASRNCPYSSFTVNAANGKSSCSMCEVLTVGPVSPP